MEEWQKQVITANLEKLIELINPDVGLLANLESSKLLGPNDIDSVNLSHNTRGKKVVELLNCLKKQKGAYERLCIALKKNFQEAAADILLQGKRNHDANLDAPENSTELSFEGHTFNRAAVSDPPNGFVTNLSPTPRHRKLSERSSIHEQYMHVTHSKLNVIIEKPTKVPQKLPNGSYKIRSEFPGVALIINIRKFASPRLNTRDGADCDSEYMFEIWKRLGYLIFREDEKSWEKETWTKDEILSTVKAFRDYCTLKKPDSIVVFIGSHGENNKIYTSDAPREDLEGNEEDQYLTLDAEIYSLFYDQKCPVLIRKPKVFFVNACRAFPNPTESDQVSDKGLPVSDMFIYLSQAPGFGSFRHPMYGSLFVHCLTFVIMKMAKESHLDEMVMEVKNILYEERVTILDKHGKPVKCGQAPSSTIEGIAKLLYFPMQPESYKF